MSTILDNFKKIGSFLLSLILPVFLFLLVTILWYYMPFTWIPCLFSGTEAQTQFGDRFEAVNALFAGLAFGGVIFAIILQWKELRLQREELEATRAEIRGQTEQLEAQDQTLKKQNFESSFFQLLEFQNEIVNSITAHRLPGYSGRICLSNMLSELDEKFKKRIEDGAPPDDETLKAVYEEFFTVYQQNIGYYFRHLYNVIKFVDQSDFFDKEKIKKRKFYINLIRAQLSSDELGLLFYNCLSDRGAKFKCLVYKYALLEDMDFKTLLSEEHRFRYKESAYGESGRMDDQ